MKKLLSLGDSVFLENKSKLDYVSIKQSNEKTVVARGFPFFGKAKSKLDRGRNCAILRRGSGLVRP